MILRINKLLSLFTTRINRYGFFMLLIWVSILSILYCLLSLLRHMHFESGAFDLGIFDQAIWQYAHGLVPYNTIKERLILGDHFNLILPLLSPLYYLWSDVRILLVFQAVWITCSAIPLFLYIKLRGFSSFVALCLSIVYSLFYGIQFAVYFDFHPVIIGVGLLAWFLYFYEGKYWKLMWASLLLIVLTQENMGIALAGIGCVYFFRKEHRRNALLFIAFGIGISFLTINIISLFSPVGYEYAPSIDLNPVHIIMHFFESSDKRLVWLYTFSWFSFLPLFSPGAVLAIVMDLSQYFLPSKQFGHMVTPFLHHRAILAIFVLLGTIDVLFFVQTRMKKVVPILAILLLGSSFFQQFIFHFPLNKLSKVEYRRSENWMQDNRTLFSFVPRDASIAASQNLVPHLSQRKEIYLAWPRMHTEKNTLCTTKECWWLDFAGKPEFLVVDMRPNQWLTQLLETNANFESAITNMEKKGKISLYKNVNDARLYKITYE